MDVEQNKRIWDVTYNWKTQGDEWSTAWGGVDKQWNGSILPRIDAFVPAPTILEIAPGFGRWTQFLKDLCEKLVVVDLSEKCIRHIKKRFDSCSHITYYVNDGYSLEMISDASIDFVFSFDSLVHAEDDVIESYVRQLATKLKDGGAGFIHHSNLGEYPTYYSLVTKIPKGLSTLNRLGLLQSPCYRAPSMTAIKFERYVEEAGMQCISQEIVNWEGRRLIDTLSTFKKTDSSEVRQNEVKRNREFYPTRTWL